MKHYFLKPQVFWIFSLFFLSARLLHATIEPTYANALLGYEVYRSASFEVRDDKWQTPAWNRIVKTNSVQNYLIFEVNQELFHNYYPSNFVEQVELPYSKYNPYGYSNPYQTAELLRFTMQVMITSTQANGNETKEFQTLSMDYDGNTMKPADVKSTYAFKGAHVFRVDILDVGVTHLMKGDGYEFELWTEEAPPIFNLRGETKIDRISIMDCDVKMNGLRVEASNLKSVFKWYLNPDANEYDLEWTFYDQNSETYATTSRNNEWYHNAFRNNATRVTVKGTEFPIQLAYPNGLLLWRVRSAQYDVNGQRQVSLWTDYIDAANQTPHLVTIIPNTHGVANNTDWNWQSKTIFAEDGKHTQSIQFYDASLRERQTHTLSNAAGTVVASETIYDYQGRPALKVMPAPKSLAALTYEYGLAKNNAGMSYSAEDFIKKPGNEPTDCGETGLLVPRMSPKNSTGAAKYYSPSNPLAGVAENKYIPDAQGYPFSVTEYTPDATGRVARQGGVGLNYQLNSQHETKYLYARPAQPELDILFGTDVGIADHYLKNTVIDPNGQISIAYVDAHGRTIATALAGDKPNNVDELKADNGDNYGDRTLTISLLNNQQLQDSLVSSYSLMVVKASPHTFNYALRDVLGYKPTKDCANLCYDCNYDLEIRITSDKCNFEPIVKTFSNYTLTTPVDDICNATNIESSFSETLGIGSYQITKVLRVNQARIDASWARYKNGNQCIETFGTFVNQARASVQATDCKDEITDGCAVCHLPIEQLTTAQRDYCNRFCKQDCSTLFIQLLNDVKPTGQYGFQRNSLLRVLTDVPVSNSVYGDDYATIRAANPVLPATFRELIDNWEDEWALFFVQKHPEYCYYESCLNQIDKLTRFEQQFQNAPQAAFSNVLPTSFPLSNDPLTLSTSWTAAGMKTPAELIRIAKASAYCINTTCDEAYLNSINPLTDGQPLTKAAFWQALGNLYLSERRLYFHKVVLEPSYCSTVPAGKEVRRTTALRELATMQAQGTTATPSNMTNSCGDVCEGNVQSWMLQLSRCMPELSDPTSNQYVLLKKYFKRICEGGCDATHPRGSTSTPTAIPCETADCNGASVSFRTAEDVMKQFCPTAYNNGANPICSVFGFAPGGYNEQYVLPTVTANAVTFNKPKIIELRACRCANARLLTEYPNEVDYINSFSDVKITNEEWIALLNALNLNTGPCNAPSVLVTSRPLPALMVAPPQLMGKCKSCEELKWVWDQSPLVIPSDNTLSALSLRPNPENPESVPVETYTVNYVVAMQYFQDVAKYFNAKTGLNSDSRAYVNFLLACKQGGTVFNAAQAYVLTKVWEQFTAAEQAEIERTKKPVCNLMLCPKTLNPPITGTAEPCSVRMDRWIRQNAYWQYQQYVQGLEGNFRRSFLNHCLSEARRVETFTDTYVDKTMHYTLYYYDQSGNLVQTVPPSGVEFVTGNVAAARQAGTTLHADHKLVTKYWYNSLNQVVKQETPDAGVSHFWYDALGRLVASQNAEQSRFGRFSYTQFDELGRTTEVGERIPATMSATGGTVDYETLDGELKTKWGLWLYAAGCTRQQVTRTYYDGVPSFAPSIPSFAAQNLRNRVAMTTFSETGSETAYDYATHYTYDVAGNVTTLIHNVPQLNEMTYRYYENSLETRTHRFKRLDYEFDLISGKVNELWYQRGAPDQFAYQYEYDADNRLVAAKTSTDGYTWVNDANYKYYKHGPLSRTEIGGKVQGVDYAYTLQGWIKGVNAGTLNPERDMGKDGTNVFMPDVFGYTIGYNKTDYAPIGANTLNFSGFEPTNNITTTPGLYNGNIRYTTNQIKGFSAISYVYGYDQLNRLSGMRSKTITGNDWSLNLTTDHNYEEAVTYDANGNIRTYWRNQETGVQMDKLTYNYDATKKNRLLSVNDAANPSAFADDVEGTETFAYDAIGNLTTHTKPSGLTQLAWNAYGKVRQVTKGTTTMVFGYDAQQNRLSKTVTTAGVTKTSYYIRDAQGNALAVYERKGGSLVWKEQDLYGSSRLGMAKPEREMTGFFWQSASYTLVTGARSYELSNHLGNVLAVISDRGELQSAQDFYPFGMAMPGRTWSASTEKYKYGFNGKETDPETGLNDFGARLYDARIGRWLSIDPQWTKFPEWSPYNYALNTPIELIDPDGESPIRAVIAAYRYAKRVYKVYTQVKAAGEKLMPKHLKNAGIEELADMAGDFVTILDGTSSGWEKSKALVDLIIGTDFNNKGAKAVDKVMDNVKGKAGVYYNKHKSGKSYVGKGDKERQKGSQKEKEDNHKDPTIETESEHHPSESKVDSEEEEAHAIRKNGAYDSKSKTPNAQKTTYNKIISGRSKVNKVFGGGKYNKKLDYKK